MRKCIRCNSDMIENLNTRVDGETHGIVISEDINLLGSKICTPKVAVCPDCGEISMYIEDSSILKL